MPSSTRDRVPDHTSEEINQRIQAEIEESVRYYASHPKQIRAPLTELVREWDIERAIEANAATLALARRPIGAG